MLDGEKGEGYLKEKALPRNIADYEMLDCEKQRKEWLNLNIGKMYAKHEIPTGHPSPWQVEEAGRQLKIILCY